MANAQDTAEVGRMIGETAQNIGAVLSAMMVGCRAEPFPRAANGGAVKPSEPRAETVRKEMQREGGSPHWEGIFALALTDLKDARNNPLIAARVRAVFVLALAEIDAAIRPAPFTRPLKLVSQNEQRAQGPVDVDQVGLDENDLGGIERLVADIDRYLPHVTELRAAAVQQLCVLRNTNTTRHVGRRRGALAMVQS